MPIISLSATTMANSEVATPFMPLSLVLNAPMIDIDADNRISIAVMRMIASSLPLQSYWSYASMISRISFIAPNRVTIAAAALNAEVSAALPMILMPADNPKITRPRITNVLPGFLSLSSSICFIAYPINTTAAARASRDNAKPAILETLRPPIFSESNPRPTIIPVMRASMAAIIPNADQALPISSIW